MSNFSLDHRLKNDCQWICDLPLCKVMLLKDAHYPWLILVPKVANCSEVVDLTTDQQQQLWRESAILSHVLQQVFAPDKLNIAAIGNVVAQLHVHHIVRYSSDLCWPKPVWGQHPPLAYKPNELIERVDLIGNSLNQYIKENS